MSERSSWGRGSAAELLRIGVERARQTGDRTGWPKIRASSLGTCVGRRHFFGRSALRLPSVVKAEPEAE